MSRSGGRRLASALTIAWGHNPVGVGVGEGEGEGVWILGQQNLEKWFSLFSHIYSLFSDLRIKILTGAMTDSDGVQERGTWRQQKLSPSHYFLLDIVSESLFPIRSRRKCTPLSPCQGLRNPLLHCQGRRSTRFKISALIHILTIPNLEVVGEESSCWKMFIHTVSSFFASRYMKNLHLYCIYEESPYMLYLFSRPLSRVSFQWL
jgi:hypothetical protein